MYLVHGHLSGLLESFFLGEFSFVPATASCLRQDPRAAGTLARALPRDFGGGERHGEDKGAAAADTAAVGVPGSEAQLALGTLVRVWLSFFWIFEGKGLVL